MAKLRPAIEVATAQSRRRIGALEQELSELEARYEWATARRVRSAAIPVVRTRQGRSVRHAGAVSAPVRLARQFYGQWPRVRSVSPFWAGLRHLITIVDDAVASGAKDALIIGEPSGIAGSIHRQFGPADPGLPVRTADRQPGESLCWPTRNSICASSISMSTALGSSERFFPPHGRLLTTVGPSLACARTSPVPSWRLTTAGCSLSSAHFPGYGCNIPVRFNPRRRFAPSMPRAPFSGAATPWP